MAVEGKEGVECDVWSGEMRKVGGLELGDKSGGGREGGGRV